MAIAGFVENATPEQRLTGKVIATIIHKGEFYVAWTRTKEGPPRYDHPAAMADLRDILQLNPT